MKNKQAIRFLRLFLCLILCLILSSSPFQMISLAYADNGDGIEIDNTGDEESDEETSDEETTDEESDEEDSDGDGISDAEEE